MMEETKFKIIGNIGELNLSNCNINSMKIDINCPLDLEYELYLTLPEISKILYGKFSLNNLLPNDDICIDNDQCTFSLNVSQWKTFQLPIIIKDFVVSKKSLWALGEDFYVDISSQLDPVLEKEAGKEIKEDFMDTEFDQFDFETMVEIPPTQKYKPESEKFCIKCCLFDSSIIICSKDLQTLTWQLDVILSTKNSFFQGQNSQSSQLISYPLISFPLTYSQSFSGEYLFSKVKNDSLRPVITFLQCDKSSDLGNTNKVQSNIFDKLLKGFPSSSSNCICLVGHPEGKLLYCLCSLNINEQHLVVDTQLEVLHDIKQPIAGIHFLKGSHYIEGNGLLIIGALGKVIYITAERLFTNPLVVNIKKELFYVTTLYLLANVKKYVLFKESIIYTSDKGELWISEFSKQEKCNSQKERELKFAQNNLTSHRFVSMTLLDEVKGIFLLVTQCGDIYLSIYSKKDYHDNAIVSLPPLMNEVMHQSSVLHSLNSVSRKQRDFFSAVSKFASLKYNGVQEFSATYSVIDIDEEPQKFIISISIKSTEKFDPNFWFVTASLYNFYQKDSVVASKTVLFVSDQTIVLEVEKLLLCSLHNSPFPLYVEVGLFLTLPENLMCEDIFSLIANQLPLYLKIKTFMLNELYVLKEKSQSCLQKTVGCKKSPKNILQSICCKNLKTAIADVLHIFPMNLIHYPQEFTICLSPKKAQIDKTTESFLIEKILTTIQNRNKLMNISQLNYLHCNDQDVSLNVSNNGDGTYITVHSKSFTLLSGLRMAMMELLLNIQNVSTSSDSKYVSIPAIVHKESEVRLFSILLFFK
ncbi:uncharacterized protein TNIN_301121 [Trichonephila inaurata madagascariensis]|uniref:Uncharacterized protein n=1 Tax=Trichonephila inaurata madagascariensis TaxID=2747483 RepID=A0A8X6XNY9_9ARAC|nr:uncharacterized protein TNIN_301121 [Trichonephila inaurata madagascariensis]